MGCAACHSSMPRVTVEHRGAFIHCTPLQVSSVLRQIEDGVDPKMSVLTQAADAAKDIHSRLLQLHPEVVRQAASNFGTFMRVESVRMELRDASIRKTPLLRVLSYISDAADAHRHLNSTTICEAVSLVKHICNAAPLPPPPQGFVGPFFAGSSASDVDSQPDSIRAGSCTSHADLAHQFSVLGLFAAWSTRVRYLTCFKRDVLRAQAIVLAKAFALWQSAAAKTASTVDDPPLQNL